MAKIYVPMTIDILTAGHIKMLEAIVKKFKDPMIYIGLLSDKALKGYKECIVPFEERKYIAQHIYIRHFHYNAIVSIVSQDSLNPYDYLIKFGIGFIASGDGWEQVELDAAKKANVTILDIKLKGEWKKKKYSSTQTKEKICQKFCVVKK